MENKRRKIHEELEVVKVGYANGVAPGFPFTEKEKSSMINEAEEAYGKFLDALKCCLLYTSPSPRDRQKSRMPSSA